LGDLLFAIRERELSLRGGLSDFPHAGSKIELGCLLDPSGQSGTLSFTIDLEVGKNGLRIRGECLEEVGHGASPPLYQVVEGASDFGNQVQIAYNNFSRGGKKPRIEGTDQSAVFTQLISPARFGAKHRRSQIRIPRATAYLQASLDRILFLDPNPRQMRGYSSIQEKRLQGDGEALSSVLHLLCESGPTRQKLLDFIRSLPEQDISDISFITTPRNEVMVQLHETFGGTNVPRDAALLSDGTLRVLAVAAALLSVPEESTVVIEEIDNGVHPSRAELLLSNILDVAQARRLKVLLTTHNPALLDAVPDSVVPNIVACFRDPKSGDSRLSQLEDLVLYPELIAQGSVGQLVTKGILDRYLKMDHDRNSERLAWISEMKRSALGS
jgi:hypothetical protein